MRQNIRDANFRSALVEGFLLLKDLLEHHRDKIAQHVLDIKRLAVTCLTRQAHSDVREKALCVLQELVEKGPCAHDLDVGGIVQILMRLLHDRSSAKVLQGVFETLGVIARRHPQHIVRLAPKLMQQYLDELELQIVRTSHVQYNVIIGCINGLNNFFYNFGQDQDRRVLMRIYGYVKSLCDRVDSNQRVAQRAALNTVYLHGSLFADQLYKDFRWWHEKLQQWTVKANEDRKAGIRALKTFYREMARELENRQGEEVTATLQYLLHYFNEKILDELSDKDQVHFAVRSFGLFAGACAVHLGDSRTLAHIFSLIVQRTEQLYLQDSGQANEQDVHHLSDYVECLGTIIARSPDIMMTDFYLMPLQHITVKLIEKLAYCPGPQQFWPISALARTIYKLSQHEAVLDRFLQVIVYQGLVRCCLHPLAMEVELQRERGIYNLVCYKDYMQLWMGITSAHTYEKLDTNVPLAVRQCLAEKVFGEVVRTVLLLIKKLNLNVVRRGASGAKQDEDDALPILDPKSGLKACMPRDFQLLANLADLFADLTSGSDPHMFYRWAALFVRHLIAESTHKPLVSSFYKLLASALRMCRKIEYLEENESARVQLTRFLQASLARLQQYKDDLLVSCLLCLLAAPVCILQPLLQQVVLACQMAFQVGRSYLPLAKAALGTLEYWNGALPAAEVACVLEQVLPALDSFLRTRYSQHPGIEAEPDVAKTRKGRQTEHTRGELGEVQAHALALIGRLDSRTALSVAHAKTWTGLGSWGSDPLPYVVPFTDMKPSIFLEQLAPRITELALDSSDRRTRVAACELLHCIVIIMVATSKEMKEVRRDYLATLLERLCPPLLQLGCDGDQVMRQLFEPLLLQLAHLYSSAIMLDTQHVTVFVEALLDGVTHPNDTSVRDLSARLLREFVDWSIRQLTPEQLRNKSFPASIDKLMQRVCQMCVHPAASQRLGAALVLGSVYSKLRSERSVVDRFWLELLYYFIKSLYLSEDDVDSGVHEQVSAAVGHLERVLVVRAEWLNEPSDQRQCPPEVRGSLLVDLVRWLLHQAAKARPRCRLRCTQLVTRLAPLLPGHSSAKTLVAAYSHQQLLEICEGDALTEQPRNKSLPEATRWLHDIYRSLDMYIWLLDERLAEPPALCPSKRMFSALLHFINLVSEVNTESAHSGDQVTVLDQQQYEEVKCTVIIRLVAFVEAGLRVPGTLSPDLLAAPFWKLLCECTLHPEGLGFGLSQPDDVDHLLGCVKKLLALLRDRRHPSLPQLLTRLGREVASNWKHIWTALPTVVKKNYVSLRQSQFVQGLKKLQECRVLETLQEASVVSGSGIVKGVFAAVADGAVDQDKSAVVLQPMAKTFLQSFLELAFLLGDQVDPVVTCILDTTPLRHPETHASVSHGDHFLSLLGDTLLAHLAQLPERTADRVLAESCVQARRLLNAVVEQVEPGPAGGGGRLVASLLSRWSTLHQWAESDVLTLLPRLCVIAPQPRGLLKRYPEVEQWALEQIASPDTPLLHKTKALELLPFLTDALEDSNPPLTSALRSFKEKHVPLATKELKEGTLDHSGFVTAFQKILVALEASRSRVLLVILMEMSCGDDHHILEDSIQKSLKAFISRMPAEQQVAAVGAAIAVFADTECNPTVRLGAARRFCVPLVQASRHAAILQVYTQQTCSLLTQLNAPLVGSAWQAEHVLVGRVGAWALFELMFANLDTGELEGLAATLGGSFSSRDLTKRAFGARSEAIPANYAQHQHLVELMRQYYCAAYNALAAVVSNTKHEAKFYTTFLFSENKDKNQVLWERLVDCSRHLQLDLYWEKLPAHKKKLVSIRQQIREDSGMAPVSYIPTHTQVLYESSLKEDLRRFDFTDSVVSSFRAQDMEMADPSSVTCVEVTLEQDVLNQNECMSTVCGVVRHLMLLGLAEETSWADALRRSLADDTQPRNARLFLVRLLLNEEPVFRKQAQAWLCPSLLAATSCLGPGLNYLLGDLLSTLVDWRTVPSTDVERSLASRVLQMICDATPSKRKDVFRYAIELWRLLLEAWGAHGVVLPHQNLLELLSPGKDTERVEAGLQLSGAALILGLEPWSPTGERAWQKAVLSHLCLEQRNLLPECAEVVGLALARQRNSSTELWNWTYSRLETLKGRKGSFLRALQCVARHYPSAPDSFLRYLLFLVPQTHGPHKRICLELVCTRLETLGQDAYREVFSLKLMDALSKIDTSHTDLALHALSTLLPHLTAGDLAQHIPAVCQLVTHHLPSLRAASLRLLMEVYERYPERLEPNVKELSRGALLVGLTEAQGELHDELVRWWSGQLSASSPRRLLDLLGPLYAPSADHNLLSSWVHLMLEATATSPDYVRKLFQHPLSACEFQPYNLDASWHTHSASIAPLFVETLANQPIVKPLIRATQTDYEQTFAPTQETLSKSSLPLSGESFLHALNSAASRTQPKTFQGASSGDQVPQIYRRRFLSDKKEIQTQVIQSVVKGKVRQEQRRQENLKKRDVQVAVYRTYRIGDFPDIEITNSAVIRPLQALAKLDTQVAWRVMVLLYSSVVKELDADSQWLVSGVHTAVDSILERSQRSSSLVGFALEVALLGSGARLRPQQVCSAACGAGHHALGCLALEKQLESTDCEETPCKRARGPANSQDCWPPLAELYEQLWEHDVVRAIFEHHVDCGDSTREALEAEAAGSWKEAENAYVQALNAPLSNTHRDFCFAAYYKCLANLSHWDTLNQQTRSQVDGELDQLWNDTWKQEKVLPWLLQSEVQLLLEQQKSADQMLEAVQRWLADPHKANYLTLHFSEELAALYTAKGSFAQARHHSAQNTALFLEEWAALSPLWYKLREEAVLKLQRAAELHSYLEFADVAEIGEYDSRARGLLKQWQDNPMSSVQLLLWEQRLMYRCGFAVQMKSKLQSVDQDFDLLVKCIDQSLHKMELSFVEAAIGQKNFHVARKHLAKTKQQLQSGLDNELKFAWHLAFSKLHWLRGNLEEEPEARVKRTLDAWNELDPLLGDLTQLEQPSLHSALCQHQFTLAQSLLSDAEKVQDTNLQALLATRAQAPTHSLVTHRLREQALNSLEEAVGLAERGTAESDIAAAHLQVASFCQEQTERAGAGDQGVHYGPIIVRSLLRSMRHGSRDARLLFPRLLQLPGLHDELRELFETEAALVPEWMFLSWLAQLLALLDTSSAPIVGALVRRIVLAYPQAVALPFRLSQETYKFEGPEGHRARSLVESLQTLLVKQEPPLMSSLVHALYALAPPRQVLIAHLQHLLDIVRHSPTDYEALRKVHRTLLDDVMPEGRGSVWRAVGKYVTRSTAALGRDLSHPSVSQLEELKRQVEQDKSLEIQSVTSLDKFSTWLDNFSHQHSPELEIPGQYTGEKKPLPRYHVRIAGFDKKVQVMPSLRLPVRITIQGDDGKNYHRLVKFGEDLRQDQRLEQLFGLMTHILESNAACKHRRLGLVTYQVVPISTRLGTIEWVNSTQPLSLLVRKQMAAGTNPWEAARDDYEKWLNRRARQRHRLNDPALYQNAYQKYSRSETVTAYQERVNLIPPHLLRNALLEASASHEAFFVMRHNFASSYAVMCIAHWLLGIGDRHPGNTLVLVQDGRCVGIDFGCAFGVATQFLSVPELMPFRLTPQILGLMGPFQQTGVLQETMVHTLHALRARESQQVLLAAMEVFVQEPSLNWLELARRRGRQHGSEMGAALDGQWFPRQKLEIALRKLQGANPAAVTEDELRAGQHVSSICLEQMVEVVRGDREHNIRAREHREGLSPESQVRCLLDQACDPHLLGKTFAGWAPWL